MPTFVEVFTDVAWTNGETITEAKLDAMVASDRYIREHLQFRPLVTASWEDLFHTSNFTSVTIPSSNQLELSIDAATTSVLQIPAATSIGGSWNERTSKDKLISSTTEGLHTLDVIGDVEGSGGLTLSCKPRQWRFVKTNEIEYLSVWWRLRWELLHQTPTAYVCRLLQDLTVLGHRAAEGW